MNPVMFNVVNENTFFIHFFSVYIISRIVFIFTKKLLLCYLLYCIYFIQVDQNRLLSLTAEIGNCESLQELILTENLIAELPSSIGKLVNLTNLNLDRNHLSEIPPQIGNLIRLGVLSLRENRLNFLPEELGMLKELHVLDVSGNRYSYELFKTNCQQKTICNLTNIIECQEHIIQSKELKLK